MTSERKKSNVLTVGYYADFSRFFYLISKETKKINSEINFTHINLHVSGALYSNLHGQKSFYLPSKASNVKTVPLSEQDAIFYKQFILYHLRLVPGINQDELLIQTKNYFVFLESYLKHTQPDLILLSGDSRMPAEVIRYLAIELGIKIMFFEQAPLGRTILDSQGVNANCSFRDPVWYECYSEPVKPVVASKREKWTGYKKYRLVDLILERFLPAFVPIEQRRPGRQAVDDNLYTLVQSKSSGTTDTKNKKKFLLVLQVPDDVNMIYHSPWFNSHADIVKSVHSNLPDDAILIVREHPLFKRLYEKELYSYISSNDNILFDNSTSLAESISSCNVVVVNNSTVGLESIELGTPVVVLGNAYYDQSPYCLKFNGQDLKHLLLKSLVMPASDEFERQKYLSYLFNGTFIDGHFRDVNGPAAMHIAQWINENVI